MDRLYAVTLYTLLIITVGCNFSLLNVSNISDKYSWAIFTAIQAMVLIAGTISCIKIMPRLKKL